MFRLNFKNKLAGKSRVGEKELLIKASQVSTNNKVGRDASRRQ